ncbi:MAG: hypothetical protein ACI4EX_13610 [Lachnospiraceae bacterium]
MSELFQYKCPCCGGYIQFNSTAQKMKCPYCDSEFEMAALQEMDEALKNTGEDKMEWDIPETTTWGEDETGNMKVYHCQSCGGEIIGDANLGATSCPYCDNPVVMKGTFAGDLKPDMIIPFKVDKNAAIEGLKKHVSGKKLLPKVFKEQNHIEEIKGIYVPFWTYDATANGNITYSATKVERYSDARYDYTKTYYYSVMRRGTLEFECVPADGSSKMEDTLMEAIEPYNFHEAKPFQTAYLAGYLADKYDVEAKENLPRINERVKKSTEETFRQTVTGYNTVNVSASSVQLKEGKIRYVLCPVWLLNTDWNGQKYTFAMNGQTGKFVGDLPLDKGAYKRWLFGLTGALTAISFIASILIQIF